MEIVFKNYFHKLLLLLFLTFLNRLIISVSLSANWTMLKGVKCFQFCDHKSKNSWATCWTLTKNFYIQCTYNHRDSVSVWLISQGIFVYIQWWLGTMWGRRQVSLFFHGGPIENINYLLLIFYGNSTFNMIYCLFVVGVLI